MSKYNNTEIVEYPVETLPEHILESEHFKDWKEMFPFEIVFQIGSHLFVDSLEIHSQEDMDILIHSENVFRYSPKTKIKILSNIYNYWKEDPNASPFRVPTPDASWFGNQVIKMFDVSENVIILSCMKKNYVDLFNYLIEREGRCILNDTLTIMYSLLYYAAVNNNMEILRRGVEVGCILEDDTLPPALKLNNLEMVSFMFEQNVHINKESENVAAEFANPEVFNLFLENYTKKYNKNIINLIFPALNNIVNLKELLLNRNITLDMPLNWYRNLIQDCVANSKSVDVIVFVRKYFGMELDDLILVEGIDEYIPLTIVKKDDLQLYTYFRKNGLLVSENLLNDIKDRKCVNITPGLVKKHLAEDKAQKLALEREESRRLEREEEDAADAAEYEYQCARAERDCEINDREGYEEAVDYDYLDY